MSGGSFTTLDAPNSEDTEALGINDAGLIVGSYFGAGGRHGFLLKDGNYITLDVPKSDETDAVGINGANLIVGAYFIGGSDHAFLAIPEAIPGPSTFTLLVLGMLGSIAYRHFGPK